MTCFAGSRFLSRASVFLGLSASLPLACGAGSVASSYCLTKTGSSCPVRPSTTSSRIDMSRTFTAEARGKASATLIFLHGLGDIGQGWCDSLGGMGLDHLRIVCPTAAVMPVSLNGGFPMPSWFDIFGLGGDAKQDENGIKAASASLKALIEEEVKRGVPAERIVIGGFSQGGAVALHAGLTGDKALAGIVALSTWLPMHKTISGDVTDVGRSIPILQCHGDSDPMVSVSVGQMSGAFLGASTKSHELKIFPGLAHSSSHEELKYLSAWLNKHVSKASTL